MKQETEYRLTNIIIDNISIFTYKQLLTYNPELIQYFDKPNIKPSKLSSESGEPPKSSEFSEPPKLSSESSEPPKLSSESSESEESPEIIRIGKIVKWTDSKGVELKGEIVNETSNSWIICCKLGKTKGNGTERDGRYYRVKRENVRL